METVLVCKAFEENLVFIAQYLFLDEWQVANLRQNFDTCASMNEDMVVKFIAPEIPGDSAVHVYTTETSFDHYYDHGPYSKFEFIPAMRK
jgi:hypothetical protein